MTTERSPEYDAFGPWIYIIDDIHGIPPLFSSFESVLSGTLMKFKIPRKIERRDADPHMDLYDAVVGIFEKKLLYIRREGNGTAECSVDLDDIEIITNEKCLLSGLLILGTAKELFEIPYNTVSAGIIDKAVTLIRKLRHKGNAGREIPALDYSLDTMEFAFYNILKSLKAVDPALYLAAWQPNFTVKRRRWSHNRILSRIPLYEKTISSFALLSDGAELIAVERSYSDKMKSTDEYRYVNSYVIIKGIRKIDLRDIPENSEASTLSIEGGAHSIELDFEKGNGPMEELFRHLSENL